MAAENPISYAQFAEMVGVSRQAVNKAVNEGRISEAAKAGKGKLYPSVALNEYRGNTDPAKQGRLKPEAREKQAGQHTAQAAPAPPAHDQAPASDFNTAKKVDMVYRAKIRELEYKEKLGKLVDKDAVYRELFNAGKELRTAILAIPDRVIDDLLACATRNEAHALLYKTMVSTLEVLAEMQERKIV